MSGNMGYRFYRCTYREKSGASGRLKECASANDAVRVTLEKPSLGELGELVKPYRAEYIPEPEQEKPISAEDDMEAALAALAARFSGSHNNNRNNRNQRNAPKKEQPERNVKRDRQKADESARKANDIVGFTLTVQYPGLYAGLGYAHGLTGQNDDIKVGFSFDYTTGLPYIPGSSLKGALRSRFINQPEDAAAALGISEEKLRQVETALFGNRTKNEDTHPGGLVCYDVFPVLTEQGKTLMATDNITPHKDPLAPPMPINTLRLAPGVQLRFCFSMPEVIVGESTDSAPITREDVRKAFSQLLVDWGIGAKTNVGYGNLTEAKR